MCIERLIFTLAKHSLCHLGQCCHYIETSPLSYGGNQWDGFYTMATLDWNKLILTTAISIYYFLFSWRNPSLLYPSVQPNQTYFSRKHKTKNANWMQMFFWIIIRLNFIPIMIHWKKVLYLENFSTQKQPTLWMRPFTTHIYHFSQ